MSESEKDEEFWDQVGSGLEHRTVLINVLCSENVIEKDPQNVRLITFKKSCPKLFIKQVDPSEPNQMQLYCDECGMVCPVVVKYTDLQMEIVEPEKPQDELDEFLMIAGSETSNDYFRKQVDDYPDYSSTDDDEIIYPDNEDSISSWDEIDFGNEDIDRK